MEITKQSQVRICMVQLAPKYKDIDGNICTANELLSKVAKDNVDFVLLPEMAFTGYLFKSKDEIKDVVEVAGQGKTFDWCKETAVRLNAAVCIGFPRIDPVDGKMYNSQMVVSPTGELVKVYDKHFLYAADKTWAEPGSGFTTFKCSWINDITIGLGICMDINPCEFEAPWDEFEFASFHAASQSEIILFSSAWCNRHPDDPVESPVDGNETMTYWLNRLIPLLNKNVHICIADRVGKEPASYIKENAQGDVTFVGSSCVISLEEPALLGALNTTQQGLLILEIPLNNSNKSSSQT